MAKKHSMLKLYDTLNLHQVNVVILRCVVVYAPLQQYLTEFNLRAFSSYSACIYIYIYIRDFTMLIMLYACNTRGHISMRDRFTETVISPSSSSYLGAEPVAPDARFLRELKNPFILQLEAPLSLLHRFAFISHVSFIMSRVRCSQPFSWFMISRSSVYSRNIPFIRNESRSSSRIHDVFIVILKSWSIRWFNTISFALNHAKLSRLYLEREQILFVLINCVHNIYFFNYFINYGEHGFNLVISINGDSIIIRKCYKALSIWY